MSRKPELNESIALSTVEELLLGESSIPVDLRAHEGLDRAKLQKLVDAIEFLVEHYKDQESVPKRLALAFVDISSHFDYTEQEYSAAEVEAFEDAGQLLTQLASQLFDTP